MVGHIDPASEEELGSAIKHRGGLVAGLSHYPSDSGPEWHTGEDSGRRRVDAMLNRNVKRGHRVQVWRRDSTLRRVRYLGRGKVQLPMSCVVSQLEINRQD